jgi:holo-[acyl-carrier protein] synthase
MIESIGVDIIEISRVREAVSRWGETFLHKVFTNIELDYCSQKRNMYQHLAARFAAKEAMSKALATGWGGVFRWQDVEVTNDKGGKPHILVYGNVKKLLGNKRLHLSISHSGEHVVAVVIVEV